MRDGYPFVRIDVLEARNLNLFILDPHNRGASAFATALVHQKCRQIGVLLENFADTE